MGSAPVDSSIEKTSLAEIGPPIHKKLPTIVKIRQHSNDPTTVKEEQFHEILNTNKTPIKTCWVT